MKNMMNKKSVSSFDEESCAAREFPCIEEPLLITNLDSCDRTFSDVLQPHMNKLSSKLVSEHQASSSKKAKPLRKKNISKEKISLKRKKVTNSDCVMPEKNEEISHIKIPFAVTAGMHVSTSNECCNFIKAENSKSIGPNQKSAVCISNPSLVQSSSKLVGEKKFLSVNFPDRIETDELYSIINKVRNLQYIPSVCIYTITAEGIGISAVDVDQYNSHLAFSPDNSHNIYLMTRDNYSVNDFGSSNETCIKYVTIRNLENKSKKRMTNNSSRSSQIHIFQHAADVTGLHFIPDGNLLMSCSLDGTVKAWNANDFRLVKSYCGIPGVFSDIHVSSDSSYFATSSRLCGQYHGSFNIFAASLYSFEKKYPVTNFMGHTDDIECVRFHPNGMYVATASCDKTIKLWSTQTSKEVRNFQDHCEGHPKKLAFSPDGKYLASTYFGSVKIWDLASGKMLKCLEMSNSRPGIFNLCYNASGSLLAAGGSDKKLQVWNIKNDCSGSSDVKSEDELIKCDALNKTIYCIKHTVNFFSCVTA